MFSPCSVIKEARDVLSTVASVLHCDVLIGTSEVMTLNLRFGDYNNAVKINFSLVLKIVT